MSGVAIVERFGAVVDAATSAKVCLTLLHSLWQVLLLALLLRVAAAVGRKQSVHREYMLHVAALFAALLALPITYQLVEAPAQQTAQPDVVVANAAGADASNVDHASTSAALGGGESFAAEGAVSALMPQRADVADVAEVSFADATSHPAAPVSERAPVTDAGATGSWLQLAPWLMAVYMLGVAAMLVRLLVGLWQSQRMVAASEPIVGGPVVESLRSLSQGWQMRVVPALATACDVVVPKVVGLLRPTILLPSSALTGLTSEQLEMILAHELAHVRRSDVWVLLLQRIAEAVLFFNPGLWYLSRRISTLREYCCDELACGSTSTTDIRSRLCYATALVHVIELAGAAANRRRRQDLLTASELASLAASGRQPSEVRRRIARLLGEPLREPLRLSRGGLISLLGMVLLTALSPALWPTTSFSDPPEHDHAVDGSPAAKEPSGTANSRASDVKESDEATAEMATIRGRFLLEDGSPADAKGWLYYDLVTSRGESRNLSSGVEGEFTSSFQMKIQPGTVMLTYFAKDYAPAWLGPLEVRPGQQIDDLEIVLSRGFSVPLQVVSETGEPVSEAKVVAHPVIGGDAGGPIAEHQTDDEGRHLLEHLAETEYEVRVEARGFEPLRTGRLKLSPGEPLELKMARSRPTTGIVKNDDGSGAAGAKFFLKNERSSDKRNHSYGINYGKQIAVADREGRFVLDELTQGSQYLIVVETEDGARAAVQNLAAGLQDVELVVPSRRDLHVKLTGDLSKLPQRNGKPFIAVRQRVDFGRGEGAQYSELLGDDATVELTSDGGEAVFRGLVFNSNAFQQKQEAEVTPGYDFQQTKKVEIGPGVTEVKFEFPPADAAEKAAASNDDDKDAREADREKAQREEVGTEDSGADQGAVEPNAENLLLQARVVDDATGKPIESFQALAGTGRMAGLGWQWQPHTIERFKDGKLTWPPRDLRGYDEQVLRIEADGYVPYQTPMIKKVAQGELLIAGAMNDGAGGAIPRIISARPGEPATLNIRLQRDRGILARVLAPDGQPAAEATVAIAIAARSVRLAEGKIVPYLGDGSAADRWRQPYLTKSDQDGQFKLPTELVPAAVVVAHEIGVAIVDARTVEPDSQLRLEPWGTIEGQVLWGEKPGAGEKIQLIAHGLREDNKQVDFGLLVNHSNEQTTDADGAFAFSFVPPGTVQLGRIIELPGEWSMQAMRPVVHLQVAAGQPTKFIFGGHGRPVLGQLAGRTDWSGVLVKMLPAAPYAGLVTDEKDPTWPAYNLFLASEAGFEAPDNAGKHYIKQVEVELDGKFKVDNVLPETYQMIAYEKVDGKTVILHSQVVTIIAGDGEPILDLGKVTLLR